MTPARDDKGLRQKLIADRKRLDELVSCLTPGLAPSLEPKIVQLRNVIEATAATLADVERAALTATEIKKLVADLVVDVGQIRSAMTGAPFAELRELVRGIASGMEIPPETGTSTLKFHAMPRINEHDQTGHKSLSGIILVAVARYTAEERTCRVRMRAWPRPWRLAA